MAKLPAVIAANKLLTSKLLVAVFIGGTSGIGEYTLRALCTSFAAHGHSGSGLRAYIVGRKPADGQKVLDECLELCPKASLSYVTVGDLSLLQDVDVACAEIVRREEAAEKAGDLAGCARVDLLVLTPSPQLFKPRTETTEGLDKFTSLLYYSRLRAIFALTPLLHASTHPSAHIISIYAAGMSDPLHPDDLTLRQPGHYGFRTSRGHAVAMTTLAFEKMAGGASVDVLSASQCDSADQAHDQQSQRQHKTPLSFCHNYPGLVITPAFTNPDQPTWFKRTWAIVGPVLARVMALKPEESGMRTLYMAGLRYPGRNESGDEVGKGKDVLGGTDGNLGSGAYGVNWNGEAVSIWGNDEWAKKGVVKEEFKEKVWEHTRRVMDAVGRGKRFVE